MLPDLLVRDQARERADLDDDLLVLKLFVVGQGRHRVWRVGPVAEVPIVPYARSIEPIQELSHLVRRAQEFDHLLATEVVAPGPPMLPPLKLPATELDEHGRERAENERRRPPEPPTRTHRRAPPLRTPVVSPIPAPERLLGAGSPAPRWPRRMDEAAMHPAHTRRVPLAALLAVNAVSTVGSMPTVVALPWFVLETTGGAARDDISGFFVRQPSVLAGIFGGAVVNRLGGKRASVVADLVRVAGIALVPLVYHTVGLAFWQLLALVFAGGPLEIRGLTAETVHGGLRARRGVVGRVRDGAAGEEHAGRTIDEARDDLEDAVRMVNEANRELTRRGAEGGAVSRGEPLVGGA